MTRTAYTDRLRVDPPAVPVDDAFVSVLAAHAAASRPTGPPHRERSRLAVVLVAAAVAATTLGAAWAAQELATRARRRPRTSAGSSPPRTRRRHPRTRGGRPSRRPRATPLTRRPGAPDGTATCSRPPPRATPRPRDRPAVDPLRAAARPDGPPHARGGRAPGPHR